MDGWTETDMGRDGQTQMDRQIDIEIWREMDGGMGRQMDIGRDEWIHTWRERGIEIMREMDGWRQTGMEIDGQTWMDGLMGRQIQRKMDG